MHGPQGSTTLFWFVRTIRNRFPFEQRLFTGRSNSDRMTVLLSSGLSDQHHFPLPGRFSRRNEDDRIVIAVLRIGSISIRLQHVTQENFGQVLNGEVATREFRRSGKGVECGFRQKSVVRMVAKVDVLGTHFHPADTGFCRNRCSFQPLVIDHGLETGRTHVWSLNINQIFNRFRVASSIIFTYFQRFEPKMTAKPFLFRVGEWSRIRFLTNPVRCIVAVGTIHPDENPANDSKNIPTDGYHSAKVYGRFPYRVRIYPYVAVARVATVHHAVEQWRCRVRIVAPNCLADTEPIVLVDSVGCVIGVEIYFRNDVRGMQVMIANSEDSGGEELLLAGGFVKNIGCGPNGGGSQTHTPDSRI
mmetsp:Transcript_14572/g.40496  ORF Transcript_14572/g.40496 Transcript_14572/m.40496 type:complete len:359 (+) Transcript_14572:843-1919(+)